MLLFFDFGFGEIFLIVVVIFLVFGPDRIPELARNIGKAINEMKRASADVKKEIDKEIKKIERKEKLEEYNRMQTEVLNDKPAENDALPNNTLDESLGKRQPRK